jgi:hypothetical protein
MADITTSEQVNELLAALGEQLAAAGRPYELVVIGGSALLALGMIDRATRDIDLLALRTGDELRRPDPLPTGLVTAAERVGRDFGLPRDWLNAGPASMLDLGMPAGFVGRLEERRYGPALTVHFASRIDQIHFKLYALVDQGPGRHESDLRHLHSSEQELIAAARWTRTHDPSPGFRDGLERVLRHFGVEGVDLGS